MITQTTWKKTSVTTPHLPLKLPLFGPPPPHPLEISVAIRGGVSIVSGNTHYTYEREEKRVKILQAKQPSWKTEIIQNTNANLRVSPFRVLIGY